MTLAIAFHRAARSEIVEAAAWYEAQKPSLGDRFLAEIEACLRRAAEQPHLYAVVHKGTRRISSRRFPYSVYFRAEPTRIVVLSVFHGSRDPRIWRRRS